MLAGYSVAQMADDSLFTNRFQSGRPVIALTLLLAVAAGVLTVVVLGGDFGALQWALGSGVALAAAIGGTYLLGRRFGQPHSHAVGMSAVVLGVALTAVVVADLLRASGRISDVLIGGGLLAAVVGTLLFLGAIAAIGRATAPS
jgi:hypothetical protein